MSDDENLNQLKVNKDYAAAYELSKRQEQMSKKSVKDALQAMQVSESESDASSSEDEDPDGLLLTPEIDHQIMETIEKIRNRDPAVYDPNVKFYREDDNDDDDGGDDTPSETMKPKKAKSVRQILAEQMIEEALNPDGDDEKLQYVPANEQVRARQAFIAADDGDDDDDDLELISKQRHVPEDDDYEQFAAAQDRKRKQAPVSDARTLGRYDQAGLSADDLFLKEYIAGEWWKEQRPAGYIDRGLIQSMRPEQIDQVTDDLSADEAFLDAQDDFEAKYNFRFEEPGGTQLVTHPRQIEDSARRADDRRAKRREKRKAAKKAAKERAVEELKQAKNQRKKELLEQAEKEELQKMKELRDQMMEERLKAIKDIGGVDVDADQKRDAILSQLVGDGDFDPDEFDKKMATVFDDDFYNGDEGADDLFVRVGQEAIDEGDIDGAVRVESKSKKKVRAKVSSEKTTQILDELYAMDFEDTIAGGDLRTRFRYTDVPAHGFGMSIEDILNTDDKELQKRVSIKQLAPYRTDRNLKRTWKELHHARNARQKRKQARASLQNSYTKP